MPHGRSGRWLVKTREKCRTRTSCLTRISLAAPARHRRPLGTSSSIGHECLGATRVAVSVKWGSCSKVAHFDSHGYGASGAFHFPSSANTAPNRTAAGLQAFAMGISVDAGRHGQTSADVPLRRGRDSTSPNLWAFASSAILVPHFLALVDLAEDVMPHS
jgi:hypothetical protein